MKFIFTLLCFLKGMKFYYISNDIKHCLKLFISSESLANINNETLQT